jgi:hypothetical protein
MPSKKVLQLDSTELTGHECIPTLKMVFSVTNSNFLAQY